MMRRILFNENKIEIYPLNPYEQRIFLRIYNFYRKNFGRQGKTLDLYRSISYSFNQFTRHKTSVTHFYSVEADDMDHSNT